MKITRDIKKRLVELVLQDGMMASDASEILNVNKNSARTIIKRFKEDDCQLRVRKVGGNNKVKLSDAIILLIEEIVENNPAATLKDIQKIIFDRQQITISITSIQNGLRKLRITLKKMSKVLDRVNSSETICKRKIYAEDFLHNAPNTNKNCIFIDESGFNLHLSRSLGRSKKGHVATITLPTVRGRMITLILAINQEKTLHYSILDKSTNNGDTFSKFMSELMDITNRCESLNNSWFIMDNVSLHKVKSVRSQFETNGNTLKYLSPYSYMLNPVERCFSKIKTYVRQALSNGSNENSLKRIIESAISTITPMDLSGYFMEMLRNVALAIEEHQFK